MNAQSVNKDVADLANACEGSVLKPGDENFEETCACWNLAWVHQPAVVVRAASEADVSLAVQFATDHDMSIAVHSTGHGVTTPADEQAVLINMMDINRVVIDPVASTATIGGGCIWGPVLAAAAEHSLAPLLGSAPNVGAVGYTLGGGFGWLARKHGMAVDSVRAMRVVLADGQIVTTSPTEHPELFWALCGTAGSSLGVVVEMTIELVAISDVYAGNLFYPLDAAQEAFDRYVEWSSKAPDELTSAFAIAAFPPLDIIPEPMRGKAFVIIRGCYLGEADDQAGEALVDEWRSWKPPLMDTWATLPFVRSAEISMDPVEPVPAATSGRWLNRLDRRVLEAMLEAVVGGDGPSTMLAAETRHAGGAVQRQNPQVSYEGRDAERMLDLVGMITGPEAGADLDRRFAETWQRLDELLPALSGCLNFVEGEERDRLYSHAFGADTQARHAEAKRQYDPGDRFRHGVSFTARM